MTDGKLFLVFGLAILASIASYTIYSSKQSTSSDFALYDFEDSYKYHDISNRFALFKEWMNKYNKGYSTIEGSHRFSEWNKNYDIVEAHNAKKDTFDLEMNRFADLPREEFASLYLGFIGNPEEPRDNVVHLDAEEDLADDSIDWRQKGAVSPIRDQGQCGGCYAFSTAGALEGLAQIKGGKKLGVYSPQQIIDCSQSYGNQGCNGGTMENVFKYTAAKGIAVDSSYPYKAAVGSCKSFSKTFQNKAHVAIPQSNTQLKAAVAKGPVSVAVEADQSVFQLYKSGVLSSSSCGTNLDHAILAVGYGTDDKGGKYYIVKNSWNTSWGEQGYIRIKRADGKGICGINQMNSYPTL